MCVARNAVLYGVSMAEPFVIKQEAHDVFGIENKKDGGSGGIKVLAEAEG